ncbi:hypothetical protein AB0I54_07370 [Streptomyces sp. NPDC050625]|uniref:hypothetical protein n=1 Tax=Streptomyces sp. NPDC050625 TaxID=3154629 RepID=UPI003419D0F4
MPELVLSFDVPDTTDGAKSPYVRSRGSREFVLHAQDGRYPLPVVTLRLAAAHDNPYFNTTLPGRLTMRPGDGSVLPPRLEQALRAAWLQAHSSTKHMLADTVLSRGAFVDTSFLLSGSATQPNEPWTNGLPVRVDVTWELDYQSKAGRDIVQGTVLLEFRPPHEEPEPTAGEEESSLPEFLTLRKPSDRHFQEFVVVDFGTTASTVTLQSAAKVTQFPVDPAQGRALGTMLGELLDPRPDWPAPYRTAVDNLLASQVRLGSGETVRGREALDLMREENPDAVDALLLAMEQIRQHGDTELREWLVPRLHRGYSRVTDTPPLRMHSLRPVQFQGKNAELTYAPASALLEDDSDGPAGAPEQRRFQLVDAPAAITGLKRQVMRLRPGDVPGSDLSAIHLTQHMYLQLVSAAEELTRDSATDSSTVQTVVVTYPTTALPEVKDRLLTLVKKALNAQVVVMDYDEGLAAGLFFVMRELSGNLNLGLEALRARSRRVVRVLPARSAAGPEDEAARERRVPVLPATWHRTMLVIDIGGGTTDIALLRLVLTDVTPERPGGDPAFLGRRYRLEPLLLGSTGHEQLGGDLLTLQVFHWLKAVLVDALWEPPGGTPPNRRSLAAQVAEQAGRQLESVVSADIKEVLDRCIPTRYDASTLQPQLARDRFHALWQLAERTKCLLGAADPAEPPVLRKDDVHEIVQSADVPLSNPTGDLPLDPGQFRRLMRPVLERAAEMGADLVRSTFEREWDVDAGAAGTGRAAAFPPVLDQVVISGRTSSMPMVQETIADVLTRADAGSRRKFGWNPTALAIETGFAAKQATSLGAAWAHAISKRAGVAAAAKQQNMSELDIVTHGLFASLPCDLGPLGQAGRRLVLLRAGEPFVELDEVGTRGIRSRHWNELPELLELHRFTSSSRSIQWGSFDLALAAARDRLDLSAPVWSGRRAKYLIEVDQQLVPQILICSGAPHYYVDSESHHLPLADLVPDAHFDPEVSRCRLPGRLCVPDAGGALVEVFPRPAAGSSEEEYFPDVFHPDRDGTQRTVPGRRAVIPVPPIGRQYEFHLDDGSGNTRKLESLAVLDAASNGPQRLHMATLDARGHLRVFRGAVPFAETRHLPEVERFPGRVYRRRMDEGRPDFNDLWNPLTGEH